MAIKGTLFMNDEVQDRRFGLGRGAGWVGGNRYVLIYWPYKFIYIWVAV